MGTDRESQVECPRRAVTGHGGGHKARTVVYLLILVTTYEGDALLLAPCYRGH